MITDSRHFYSQLVPNKVALCDLLNDSGHFRDMPRDWHVIITDITDSTKAVSQGRHHDVNLIATGSMVIVLNVAFSMHINIPFFFGGDGATFLVPSCVIAKAMHELEGYRSSILKNFGLQLRAGSVAVQDIYQAGHRVDMTKFWSSSSFSIPVALGNGLAYAEHLIKSEDFSQVPYNNHDLTAAYDGKPNLKGMVCRWDTIAPPKRNQEVITLLVMARNCSQQAAAYTKILNIIDELYGKPEKRQPISVAKLRLNSSFRRLGAEMRVRIGTVKKFELLREWLRTMYVRYYFKTTSGKDYLNTLVEMSDTLIIDGRLNTIISGHYTKRPALKLFLDDMELHGEIFYGMHVSAAAVMSCYVRNLEGDHVHFVDGSEGGYTKAAIMLKEKLRKEKANGAG